MIPILKSKGRGTTVAGIFGVAFTALVLLCGAGSMPVENFSPQGPMQADLNAGGHNITNAATVSGTNVVANALSSNLIVPLAQGGTGTPTPSLVAGTNVTVTGSFPNQRINAAGVTSFSSGTLNPLFGTTVTNAATAPALSFTLNNAAQAAVLAGPASGGAGAPAYRALAATDIPTLNQNTTGNAATASAAPLSGISGLGAGEPVALTKAVNTSGAPVVLGSGTLDNYGVPQTATIPAGSVVAIIGDSVQAGYNGSTTTTPPAQTLSGMAGFANVPVYDFAISGTTAGPTSATANSGLAILAADSPSYVEFLNGAQTATGNASVASLCPAGASGGIFYFIAAYGANDIIGRNGMTLTNYETSMASIWSTAHGYGANVKVIDVTITDSPNNGGTATYKPTRSIWNGWLRGQTQALQGAGAAYPDYIADENAFFTDLTPGTSTGDIWSIDGLHPTAIGQKMNGYILGDAVLRSITYPCFLGINPVVTLGSNAFVAPQTITTSATAPNTLYFGALSNSYDNVVSLNGLNVQSTMCGIGGGGGNNNFYLYVPASGQFQYYAAGLQVAYIDASGDIYGNGSIASNGGNAAVSASLGSNGRLATNSNQPGINFSSGATNLWQIVSTGNVLDFYPFTDSASDLTLTPGAGTPSASVLAFLGSATINGSTTAGGFKDTTSGHANAAVYYDTTGTLQPMATGTATLVAGTKTVAYASLTSTTKIRLYSAGALGGTPGAWYVASRTNGTGFTISSTQASDVSVVGYDITPQ